METVTLQVAVYPPSLVLQVMFAVPADFAVTTPVDETVATDVFDDVQVTFLLVALLGVIIGVRVVVSPIFRVLDVVLSETPVTAILELPVSTYISKVCGSLSVNIIC